MKLLEIYLEGKYDDLFKEGLKYYPHMRIDYSTNLNDPKDELRVFPFRKNKGSYSIGGFRNDIRYRKLRDIYKHLQIMNGVNDLYFANQTNSIYFTLNNKVVRISDHNPSKLRPNNIDIRFGFSTDVGDVIKQIESI